MSSSFSCAELIALYAITYSALLYNNEEKDPGSISCSVSGFCGLRYSSFNAFQEEKKEKKMSEKQMMWRGEINIQSPEISTSLFWTA